MPVSKRVRPIAIATFVLAVAVGGSRLFLSANPKPYETATVAKRDVVQTVPVNGTVESSAKIALHFQRSGKVRSIPVKIGDSVKAGAVLANLDTSVLEIQEREAQWAVSSARAALALRAAGISAPERLTFQRIGEQARGAYDAAERNVSAVERANSESLRNAQEAVDSGESALSSAETLQRDAESVGGAGAASNARTLANTYADTRTAVGNALTAMESALDLADSILGMDHPEANADFKATLGALDASTLTKADDGYRTAEKAISDARRAYANQASWGVADADGVGAVAEKVRSAAGDVGKLLDDTRLMLLKSVPSATLPQENLTSFKNSVVTQEASVAQADAAVRTARQSTDSAQSGVTTGETETKARLDAGRAAVEDARRRLDMARAGFAKVRADGEIALLAAQSDADDKSGALAVAQATYAEKTAEARPMDLAALRAGVDQAENALRLVEQEIKDSRIEAPDDGIVAEISVRPGENVAESDVAVTFLNPNLSIAANVSETNVAKIRIGQKAAVTFDAFPQTETFSGTVTDVHPAETLVQGVPYYRIRIDFAPHDPAVKSGMTAEAAVVAENRKDVLSVPSEAVRYGDSKKPYVEVLNGGKAEKREVAIGAEGDGVTEISSGVRDGETVVVPSNQTR